MSFRRSSQGTIPPYAAALKSIWAVTRRVENLLRVSLDSYGRVEFSHYCRSSCGPDQDNRVRDAGDGRLRLHPPGFGNNNSSAGARAEDKPQRSNHILSGRQRGADACFKPCGLCMVHRGNHPQHYREAIGRLFYHSYRCERLQGRVG